MGRASIFGYVSPHEEEEIQALEREYMAKSNSNKSVFKTCP